MTGRLRSEILDYLSITVGVTIYAAAVTFFFLPYKLTSGGVTGIGSLIYYATGFEVQYSYFIINAVLLLMALRTLGWKFLAKTIYATNVITLVLWLLQRLHEYLGSPMLVGDELFMATVIGAIAEGVGLAICFMAGGSTGGTDIIAAVINKYRNVSLGTVMMLFDFVIISCSYIVFRNVQLVIFGYVYLIIASMALDYFIRSYRQSVEFKIYSRNPIAIADAIISTGRGVTILDGMGYFTKSDRKVVISVVRRREQAGMFRMIKNIDPYAFVTMGNVTGVWGEGFDVMKVREARRVPRRQVVVLATDDADAILSMQQLIGPAFEVRSLKAVGIDTDRPLNDNILTGTAEDKAAYVKNYYGFDTLVPERDVQGHLSYIVSTGSEDECFIHRFADIEQVKAHLTKKG